MLIEVILGDDHVVVREGLRMLLEAHPDIRVVGEAADGREAVHLVRTHCPNVLIMDIGMVGLNGIEATRQVRIICPATQVVILSMYSSIEHVTQALRAGALGYVLKESTGADVVAAVRAVHAGRLYLSQKIVVVRDEITARPGVSPLESLSVREREILQLVVEGQTSSHIAMVLGLSPKTVETYRSRLMHKLGIDNLPSLVKFAIQHGLTSLE